MFKKRELRSLIPDFERSQALRGLDHGGILCSYRLLVLASLPAVTNARESLSKRLRSKAEWAMLYAPNLLDKELGASDVASDIWVPEGKKLASSSELPNHSECLLVANGDLGRAAGRPKGLWAFSGYLESLRWALAQWLRKVNLSWGFEPFSSCVLVPASDLLGTGQLPKFERDLIKTNLGFYLSPTSEVQLGNLNVSRPRKICALSSCFRSEVSYGKRSAGLIRTLEFEKFELFAYSYPKLSSRTHRAMIVQVCQVLRALRLPHRLLRLGGREIGFAASKTYDLEVWLPGSGFFMEIASISNCRDFQTRRRGIRTNGLYMHTLNGSCLPLGRTLVALMENHFDVKSGRLDSRIEKVLGLI